MIEGAFHQLDCAVSDKRGACLRQLKEAGQHGFYVSRFSGQRLKGSLQFLSLGGVLRQLLNHCLHVVEPLLDRLQVIDEYFSRLVYGVIHLEDLNARVSPASRVRDIEFPRKPLSDKAPRSAYRLRRSRRIWLPRRHCTISSHIGGTSPV